MDDDFAPPPFDPAAALQNLARELRALGLAERAGRYERRGIAIARTAVDGPELRAARVKRPSRNSPEWIERTLRNAADLRDFVADLKRQLALWGDRDE